jgi:hypothetical protein
VPAVDDTASATEEDIVAAQEEMAGPESPWRAAGAFVHQFFSGRWWHSIN